MEGREGKTFLRTAIARWIVAENANISLAEEAVAAYAISKVLARYVHGIDRCDTALVKSVYWPEATDDHGVFRGNGHEFAEFVIAFLREAGPTVHHISNIHVDLLTPSVARVQSYFMALHEHLGDEIQMGGRYLDTFEKRDNEWKILERITLIDWNQTRPTTFYHGDDAIFSPLIRGIRGIEDRWYSWRTQPVQGGKAA